LELDHPNRVLAPAGQPVAWPPPGGAGSFRVVSPHPRSSSASAPTPPGKVTFTRSPWAVASSWKPAATRPPRHFFEPWENAAGYRSCEQSPSTFNQDANYHNRIVNEQSEPTTLPAGIPDWQQHRLVLPTTAKPWTEVRPGNVLGRAGTIRNGPQPTPAVTDPQRMEALPRGTPLGGTIRRTSAR